jgi:hypothetical protein
VIELELEEVALHPDPLIHYFCFYSCFSSLIEQCFELLLPSNPNQFPLVVPASQEEDFSQTLWKLSIKRLKKLLV